VTPPTITDVTGVWHVEIAPLVVGILESLSKQPGIVDTWLPGRKVLVVDHGASLDISTCTDSPNLPATSVVWSEDKRAYIPTHTWTFGDFPLDISITRTDNNLSLKVAYDTYHLDFGATKLPNINNSFQLSGDVIADTHLTDITCGAVTHDETGDTLQVTAYYKEAFMNFAFPVAAVGSYDFDYGAVQLVSPELETLLNPVIAAAHATLEVPMAAQVKVDFDLTTDDALQLHGEATLNELTLP